MKRTLGLHAGSWRVHATTHARTIVALFTLLVAVTFPAAAQRPPSPDILARTDSIFARMNTPTTPGCAVSIMQQGAIAFEQGYGMANLEYGIPITPHSVFHVASVSKHFTAMAIELLVNEGRVSWDDDIRTYVPEVPDFGQPITLRHLVHHVSGLRDQWNLLSMAGWRWEADVVTQKDVLDIVSRQKALNFAPGERYLYSNTGYTLLAVVVERVTGQTLREFAQERMLEPLGMTQTHFHDDHEMIVPNRAFAYAPDSTGLYGLKQSIPDFDVVGATSLFTTAHDLAAWDRNFYTGRVGGREALARLEERFVLTSGDTIDYAHGLSIGNRRGLRTVAHSGADAGYRSFFMRVPEQEWSVAVLCNFPSSNPAALANRVADVWLEHAYTEPAPVAGTNGAEHDRWVNVPRSTLASLTGVYRDADGFDVRRIELHGDTLKAIIGPSYPLRPLGNDRYEVVGAGVVLVLQPPRNGEPATMTTTDAPDDMYVQLPAWTPSADDLTAFAGTYYSDELGTEYRFEVEDGRLVFHHRKLPDTVLEPTFENGFTMRGRAVVFERGADGRVSGFRISDGRVYNVAFERVR